MKRLKPLNLLDNKGFWPEKAAIADAIKEVFTAGRCTNPMPVHDFGRYRDPREWRNQDNELVAYKSVDWYVYDALDEDRMQVDVRQILSSFVTEPWRNDDMLGDHYDLFIMQEDMFDPDVAGGSQQDDYTVGRAARHKAAVISTHRIEHIWGMPYSYLKTEIMRQLCFMFGVPSESRDDVVRAGGGLYCRNRCILRLATKAPDDWDALTGDRIKGGALCEACTRDLGRFFRKMADEAD